MKGLFTASRTRELDAECMKARGWSGLQLMDHAVEGLWRTMQPLLPQKNISVFVLVGPGNNGGDGLGLAAKFLASGYKVSLYGDGEGRADEWRAERERVKALPLQKFSDLKLQTNALVIDAIFGSGFHDELPTSVREVSRTVRHAQSEKRATLWALDVPSGIDGDFATAAFDTFVADHTFEIGTEKYASYHPALVFHFGERHFVDIGLSLKEPDLYLIDRTWISEKIPKRSVTDHKTSHGRLQIVGGSRGTPGAGILSALAAFKSGCGYVYVETDDEPSFVKALPEAVLKRGENVKTAVVGPGLGRDTRAKELIEYWTQTKLPLVIDADALSPDALKFWQGRANTVITPHPLEAARLLGVPSEEVNRDRLKWARELHEKFGVTVLLKGAGTLVADGERVTLNPTGNEGMATAGQGDALSGIIGAMLMAGLVPADAARVGAYLHGACGDMAASQSAKLGILAHESVALLPQVMSSLAGPTVH